MDIVDKIDATLNEATTRSKKYDFDCEMMLHAPITDGEPARLVIWPANGRVEIEIPTSKTYPEILKIDNTHLKKETQNLMSLVESAVAKLEKNMRKVLK